MDLETLRELYRHQAWADARILAAVRAHPGAVEDADLRIRLHHIVGVQRAYLSLFLERPFDVAAEMRTPESFEEIASRFSQAHAEAIAFVGSLDDAGQARIMEIPWIPGLRSLSVGQALLQAVMHSQHHRGQCAMRLRALGGSPPMVDYVLWLKDSQSNAAGVSGSSTERHT